jgi:hypothetical protein
VPRDTRPMPDIATANPVDVLEWLANRAGRPLDPEWLSAMRTYCEEPYCNAGPVKLQG